MLKDTQGEMRTAPRRGADSVMAGMRRVVEGCGCERCESKERTRFAPAESPLRRMFCGR